jgi:hypothetical protein
MPAIVDDLRFAARTFWTASTGRPINEWQAVHEHRSIQLQVKP